MFVDFVVVFRETLEVLSSVDSPDSRTGNSTVSPRCVRILKVHAVHSKCMMIDVSIK